jgi:pseudoazurin
MEKKMNIAATIFALALALPTIGSAETVQIEFTKFDTFSIEVVHINVGDTVDWLPKNAGHNVEFIAGPQMHALPKSSKMDELHSVVFKTTGVYLYGCTPHLNMGMLGLVVVGNDLHNLEKLSDIRLSRIAKSVLEDLIKIAKSNSE